MKIIGKFPAWFSKQRRGAKVFLVVMGSLILICICGLLSTVFTRPNQTAPSITATYKGADSVVFITWTPPPPTITPTPNGSETPTSSPFPTASPTPTDTPLPTDAPLPTGLPTQSFETATVVVLPATLSAAAAKGLVVIIYVDKELEYVDIQNAGIPTVNLKGWKLVSEVGNQTCYLTGILQPKDVLRIWAGRNHQVGLNCGFHNFIWIDNALDPAVLYNADGEEVSRYPKP